MCEQSKMPKGKFKAVVDKAKELGCLNPCDSRINWIWANGFPTVQAATEFVEWLEANDYEHRGVYPNGKGGADVRYRW